MSNCVPRGEGNGAIKLQALLGFFFPLLIRSKPLLERLQVSSRAASPGCSADGVPLLWWHCFAPLSSCCASELSSLLTKGSSSLCWL